MAASEVQVAPAPVAAAPAVPAAAAASAPAQAIKNGRGLVKQVISGDIIIIRGQPRGGPPPEKRINLSNIMAPKMARRGNPNDPESVDTIDEPYAWQARENLRKKVIGKEVYFEVDYAPSADRCYATVFLGTNASGENLNRMQVAEGLAEVRKVNARAENEEYTALCGLEDAAKVEKKGKWAEERAADAIRDVSWTVENARTFVDSYKNEPVPAVIELVRDGCTMRASLPSHHQITFILSGVKCPMIRRNMEDNTETVEPFGAEAKFFVESRLLQRDVKIILEGVSNNNIMLATVLHPNGNMTELLLREGFARCVDWSITSYTQGPEKLRALEKAAKERKVRIWKNYVPKTPEIPIDQKNFTGKVIQIVQPDSIAVKTSDDKVKTIHLSSVRPPRFDDLVFKVKKEDIVGAGRKPMPLYDTPYMFEAREFLRKKLIGKKVNICVDYIKAENTENGITYSGRTCCTVTSGGINIAEALVSKGLVKVVRHRQDDDSRSSHYDDLLAAEQRAIKAGKGLNSKKEPPLHKVADISGAENLSKAKNYLPSLQRAGRIEALVEYVFGGSRMKMYLPKNTCTLTFLLAGIDCPRGARTTKDGATGVKIPGDAYAEDALAVAKEHCMHREVTIEVDAIDRVGNFIGWLFVDGVNLSQLLVEKGLSKLHFTAERSNYYKQLLAAEDAAKAQKLNIWKDYEEPEEVVVVEEPTERKTTFKSVYITEITSDLHVYCQFADNGPKLEALMEQMRAQLAAEPPLAGAYKPRRGDFCVAQFTEDDLWYRARIEKISQEKISVHYIDFGNKEVLSASRLAALPTEFNTQVMGPQAHEYGLALVKPPTDVDSLGDAFHALCNIAYSGQFLINTEYKDSCDHVSLVNQDQTVDVGKTLVGKGFCTVAKRGEKRLNKLVGEFMKEQEKARNGHLNLWRYGDITEDDASEFGYKK